MQSPRRIGRSVGALLAGILVGVTLSLGTDVALHAVGIAPPISQWRSASLFALATAYRAVYNIVASYVVARLAPDRPMGHAMVAGALGLVASIVGAVVTWNRGPDFGPHWYPLSLVALAIPCAWLGGKIRVMQLRAKSAS
jgi:hypothetical protein